MTTLPSLEELGRAASLAAQDLFDDETCIWFSEQTDIAKVIWRYSHAESDTFAFVLSSLTGWPVIGVAPPGRGPSYLLVESPQGLIDVTGKTSLDDLKSRFRNPSLDLVRNTQFEVSLTDAVGAELEVLAALRYLSVDAFTESGFIELLESRIAILLGPAEPIGR